MYTLRSSVTSAARAAKAAQAAETGTLPVTKPRTSRKQTRRVLRKLTSLEVKMVKMGQQLPGSPNKRAQKRQRSLVKLRRAARYITGLLIRFTGVAAPELVAQPSKLDAYKTKLSQGVF